MCSYSLLLREAIILCKSNVVLFFHRRLNPNVSRNNFIFMVMLFGNLSKTIENENQYSLLNCD